MLEYSKGYFPCLAGVFFFFFFENNVGLAHSKIHCHHLIKLQYVFTLRTECSRARRDMGTIQDRFKQAQHSFFFFKLTSLDNK